MLPNTISRTKMLMKNKSKTLKQKKAYRLAKRSQIKMGESIAVMVIFFFLLVFGFSFYAAYQKRAVISQKAELTDYKSIELTQQTMFIPEIQCTVKNIVSSDNCFDILKIKALRDLIMSDESAESYYYDLFGFSEIRITQIYPKGDPIILYSKVLADDKFSVMTRTRMAATLYDASTGRFNFGIVEISMYG